MMAQPDDTAPANILLVDDRPSNLTSLAAILNRRDYNLVSARSGEEALAHLLREEFAVIVLDVAMPGLDGFETATIIKQRERSKLIPIIFITASVYEMEHIFRGYTVGAVDYLIKPVDPHQVRAKVAVFVELFQQRQQIEHQSARLREAELREQKLLRERAENALRESEAAYEITFEEAPVGIGHATPEGLWTRTNARLREILGYDGEAPVGRSIAEATEGEDAASLAEAISRLKSGDASVHAAEHRLISLPGTGRWISMTLAALREEGLGVKRIIAVVDDISERKQLELERSRLLEELKDAVRARDDFLSIATHELNTPMTPLRLQTTGLLTALQSPQAGPPDAERLVERLGLIDRAAARLQDLIDRLLDVSRLTIGRMSLEREEVDLADLVKEVAVRLNPEVEQAGGSLSLQAEASVTGRWDRFRLEQVATNLLSNAIKYGEAKPVEASVTRHGPLARLVVRDHGLGIPKEAQARIFERFERLVPVRHYGGFGLGLWITRQIVEAHGGNITVESRPGEGSQFTVELPLEAATAESLPKIVGVEPARLDEAQR